MRAFVPLLLLVSASALAQSAPTLVAWVAQHQGAGEEVPEGRRSTPMAHSEFDEALIVVLVGTSGGNGAEPWLLLLQNHRVQIARALSPESSRPMSVDDIRWDGAQLVLDVRRVGPRDAWCCPRQRGTLRYRIQDGRLVRDR